MAKRKKEILHTAVCMSCGTFIEEGSAVMKNNSNYCRACAVLPEKNSGTALFVPDGILRIICYVVSFFSPPAGFVLGAVYFAQKEKEQQSFAVKCFIFMAVGLIILAVVFLIMSLMGIADLSHAVSGTNGSDYAFTEDYY